MKKRFIGVLLAGMMLLTTGCAKIQEVVDSFNKEEEPIEIEYEEEDPIIINYVRYDISRTFPFSEGRAWVEYKRPDLKKFLALIDEEGNVLYKTDEYSWPIENRRFTCQDGVSYIIASKQAPYKYLFIDKDGNEIGSLEDTDEETYEVSWQCGDRFLVKKHTISDDVDSYYVINSHGEQACDLVVSGNDLKEMVLSTDNGSLIQLTYRDSGRGYFDLRTGTGSYYTFDYAAYGFSFISTEKGVLVEFETGSGEEMLKGIFSEELLERKDNYTSMFDFYANEITEENCIFTAPAGTHYIRVTYSGMIYTLNYDSYSINIYDINDKNRLKHTIESDIVIYDMVVSEDSDDLAVGFNTRKRPMEEFESEDIYYKKYTGEYWVTVINKDGEMLYEPFEMGTYYPNVDMLHFSKDYIITTEYIVTPSGEMINMSNSDISKVDEDVAFYDYALFTPNYYWMAGGYMNKRQRTGLTPGFVKISTGEVLDMVTVEADETDDLSVGTQTGMDMEEGETTITYYDADGNEVGTETVTDDNK